MPEAFFNKNGTESASEIIEYWAAEHGFAADNPDVRELIQAIEDRHDGELPDEFSEFNETKFFELVEDDFRVHLTDKWVIFETDKKFMEEIWDVIKKALDENLEILIES